MASVQCEKCGRVFQVEDGEQAVCPVCRTAVSVAEDVPAAVTDPAQRELVYAQALEWQNASSSFGEWETAGKLFDSVGDFRDAPQRAAACYEQAAQCNRAALYEQAKNRQGGTAEKWAAKAELMRSIAGYRDADMLATEYQRQADEMAEQDASAQQAQDARQQQERAVEQRQGHRRRRVVGWCVAIGAVVIAAVLALSLYVIPNNRYQLAVAAYESGDYEAAVKQFSDIGHYRDSAAYLQKANYQLGRAALESGDTLAAADYLDKAGDVEDAPALHRQVCAALYERGMTYWRENHLTDAQEYFDAAGGYEDAKAYKQLCRAARVWRGENPPDADKMSVEKAKDALTAEISGLWRGENGQDVTIRSANLTIADNSLQVKINGETYEARMLGDAAMSLIGDGALAGNYQKV